MSVKKGTTSKCRSCNDPITYTGFGWKHDLMKRSHEPRPLLEFAKEPDVEDKDLFDSEKKPVSIPVSMNVKVPKKSTYLITRVFPFDAAHRVFNHTGKCRNLHGHRYILEVQLQGEHLENGMLMDFGVIKTVINQIIEQKFDHNIILFKDDPLVEILKQDTHTDKKPIILASNPTAENIVVYLFHIIKTYLFVKEYHQVTLHRCRLYETPNCFADYYGGVVSFEDKTITSFKDVEDAESPTDRVVDPQSV